MLTSELIKQKALEYGATICGIGNLNIFHDEVPQRDPKMILPNAKSIIGFGIAVPRGLYEAMEFGNQIYTYTTVGVKYIDDQFAEILLLKMGRLIENEGYDACLQKTTPHLRIQGDKETNPEVMDTYELIHSVAVEVGKPVPDVIIDYSKAAVACGLGRAGLYGKILNPVYGPFMRYCFIITDIPLKSDALFQKDLCDGCGKCIEVCPGNAISDKGLDTWQCSVYYKGAHQSNPFITNEFLKDDAKRKGILSGEKKFNAEEARKIYPQLDFLPNTQGGYSPCLCGKKCDIACYKHLKEIGKI